MYDMTSLKRVKEKGADLANSGKFCGDSLKTKDKKNCTEMLYSSWQIYSSQGSWLAILKLLSLYILAAQICK